MIRFVDNTSIHGGEEQPSMKNKEDHMENKSKFMKDKIQNTYNKCSSKGGVDGIPKAPQEES